VRKAYDGYTIIVDMCFVVEFFFYLGVVGCRSVEKRLDITLCNEAIGNVMEYSLYTCRVEGGLVDGRHLSG
jgi:hypothetical protein